MVLLGEGALRTLSNPKECAEFLAALEPRILVEVMIPNQDARGRALPQPIHVAQFQSLFTDLCGGFAPMAAGQTRFQPAVGPMLVEQTVALRTYLPDPMPDALGQRLLNAILAFGHSTRQEMVLVAVGVRAFRFRFLERGALWHRSQGEWLIPPEMRHLVMTGEAQ